MKKTFIIKLALVAIFMCAPYFVPQSHAGLLGDLLGGLFGGGSGGSSGGADCAPLDGGLSLLALAGAGYGLKRFGKRDKKQEAKK